ncbi:cytochrome P450 [Ancylobacter sp. A5.8]|uniref:cytochrome P450 n=1 Tax=Ancylobacter gelatini TaxID=2919920 RepID=UPI001F4EA5BE|nr:cytochrome P450 [Ancylobacter gelatini]MCJ8143858.1 cytochrome P450 [Ancylobacter gelatini]
MTGTPRIRAFLPGKFHRLSPMPAPTRAGDAPQVFRQFARTLGKLERAAATRKPGGQGEGA